MKKEVKGYVSGLATALVLMGVTTGVYAAARNENISVAFNDIRIMVNGSKVSPTDAQGREIEPFVYNGTTYLPVRAVADALGQDVAWEAETQTVWVGLIPPELKDKPASTPEPEVTAPVAGPTNIGELMGEKVQYFAGGEDYAAIAQSVTLKDGTYLDEAIVINRGTLGSASPMIPLKLDGRFREMTFTIGQTSNSDNLEGNLFFKVDGETRLSPDGPNFGWTNNSPSQTFTVDVTGAQELMMIIGVKPSAGIYVTNYDARGEFAISGVAK